jgi:sulfopyruvate decarboxylase TPP-binding subunit
MSLVVLDGLRAAEVEWLVYVPSSGLDDVYEYFAQKDRAICVTREEEAIAIVAGLTLNGKFGVPLIQQSGVGNCLNAVFTLAVPYEIEFPILVYDRGVEDPNPVQAASSALTNAALQPFDPCVVDLKTGSCAMKAIKDAVSCRKRWVICRS